MKMLFALMVGISVVGTSPALGDCSKLLEKITRPNEIGQLPQVLKAFGDILIENPTPLGHEMLAQQARQFLARERNVSATLKSAQEGHFLIIDPTPLDSKKPENWLTRFSRTLDKHGYKVIFVTEDFLAGQAAFTDGGVNAVDGKPFISLMWDNLYSPHLTEIGKHERFHLYQHYLRALARAGSLSPKRRQPDMKMLIRFVDDKQSDNKLWQRGYGGFKGHTLEELSAYTLQMKEHLKTARRLIEVFRNDPSPEIAGVIKQHVMATILTGELLGEFLVVDVPILQQAASDGYLDKSNLRKTRKGFAAILSDRMAVLPKGAILYFDSKEFNRVQAAQKDVSLDPKAVQKLLKTTLEEFTEKKSQLKNALQEAQKIIEELEQG